MKCVDLTHLISTEMPVYPGTEPPKLAQANTLEKDGFKETLLEMYSHTGTHMDSPAHLFEDGVSLDQMKIEKFVGKAIVVNCTDVKEGEKIELEQLKCVENHLSQVDFVLFYTGWSKKWGTPEYFGKFPVVSNEVIDKLIKNNVKGIGLDVISIDPLSEEYLPIHRKVLKENIVIIENLANLEKLESKIFTFCALPLKFKEADGAPIRAVAILDM